MSNVQISRTPPPPIYISFVNSRPTLLRAIPVSDQNADAPNRGRGRGRGRKGCKKGAAEREQEEEDEETGVLLDDKEIHYREDYYQELRHTMGIATMEEADSAPARFPPPTLEAIQYLCAPLSAGELLSRLGHFLRLMGPMMDEVELRVWPENTERGKAQSDRPLRNIVSCRAASR